MHPRSVVNASRDPLHGTYCATLAWSSFYSDIFSDLWILCFPISKIDSHAVSGSNLHGRYLQHTATPYARRSRSCRIIWRISFFPQPKSLCGSNKFVAPQQMWLWMFPKICARSVRRATTRGQKYEPWRSEGRKMVLTLNVPRWFAAIGSQKQCQWLSQWAVKWESWPKRSC